jgi:DNA repair exonuclease SbcCD ATPase subunit
MEAAHITWRPLGQLFVERGLITQDELEEALVEQHETRNRLGAILVARGLVSGPELTSVLVDQLGMELTKESGFGSGLWDEIRRRHPRGRTSEPNGDAEHADAEPAPAEEPPPVALVPEQAAEATVDEEKLQESLARERAALAVAHDEERAELQAALSAERAALESALAEEREAREQALQELVKVRAEAAARTTELGDLAKQVSDLRGQIVETTARVTAEQHSTEVVPELEKRVSDLETELAAEQSKSARVQELEARIAEADAALATEQAKSADAAAELEHARGEASAEAKQLRESIERLRVEIDQLDAATAWFEYWSGASTPPRQS